MPKKSTAPKSPTETTDFSEPKSSSERYKTEDAALRVVLAANLKRIRNGRPQTEIAEAVGLNPAHISRIESQKYSPSAVAIRLLMTALSVDANALLLPYVKPTEEETELLNLFEKIRRLHPTQRIEVVHLVSAQLAGLSASVVTKPHPIPFDENTFFETGLRVRKPTGQPGTTKPDKA